ncbi:nucleoside/nucleotide kinase family protein [Streptomyces lunaelactis]|uniref:nucleoside/nucleotide kinase family protein n=1 Tax=Streptomyces lunaelactis TaxID=1535768 RepID=UPI001584D2B2|nr:nucleoside/nucleotide kinase family protein [Streptomyces lunaelactis]NUJ99827.1 nucleoside/nucleotide kinase family protein [Streptomyces lunaelactis]NUK13905.1 nucleoside/nucleotide kinase family protein [Streptomyces lunaelactis]NUK22212.1 nucleoside/nucleotide kinase family protein [Streptomyces lunaelactis]NUK48763.1 nucleoside/nucleotide kinase family protein [Streptomyces lunaelactis]NUK62590.1 nucleoside/nucleotide kinase family protein [Streptomyces lunaelactis]
MHAPPPPPRPQYPPHLLYRARELAVPGRRLILGIAGAPGAGKTTLAAHLVDALDGLAVLVPMDGFHLAQAELARLGRAGRKGAPDTFDAAGYAALLARLRVPAPGGTVYAPAFDRALEEAVAGSIPVDPNIPLVVTEGNYLLHDGGPWAQVRPLLDEVWYLEIDDAVRVRRLVDRHVRYGKQRAYAERWVQDSDERNARLVARGRNRADFVVTQAL